MQQQPEQFGDDEEEGVEEEEKGTTTYRPRHRELQTSARARKATVWPIDASRAACWQARCAAVVESGPVCRAALVTE